MEAKYNEISRIAMQLESLVVHYGLQFLFSLLLLIIGFWIGGKFSTKLENNLLRKGFDRTLASFLSNLTKGIFSILVSVMAVNQMGFAIGPLVAALGAMAFGASFAIQGLVSNLGAGVAIIVLRPFKLGDTIFVQGQAGLVKQIKLMQTVLENEEKELITIPNHMILGQILVNSGGVRLAEETIGVAYESNVEEVRKLLSQCLKSIEGVEQDPSPQVGLDSLGDFSLNFKVRYRVPTEKYHEMRFKVVQSLYEALNQKGVEIPFPRRDLKIIKTDD